MSTIWDKLRWLRGNGKLPLRDLDIATARLIADFLPPQARDERVLLAAALVSRAGGDGHTCLDLDSRAGTPMLPPAELDLTEELNADDETVDEATLEPLPQLADWLAALRASPCVGQPGDERPLILDAAGRLYLHRYWQYETQIVTRLQAMATPLAGATLPAQLGERLAALFPAESDPDAERRRLAAFSALTRRLTILSGGPGTGKTTTIARIISILQGTVDLRRIKLAAPTGKAAKRMTESLRGHAAHIPNLPTEAYTLHRLLGYIPGSPRFRHHRENPVIADLVIVDEASMIDLPMMAKLLDAIGENTRLVLLGDMDQLASVEPGAVFGDICRGAAPRAFSRGFLDDFQAATGLTSTAESWQVLPDLSLADCHVQLRHSHRFPAASTVGRLAAAINTGDDPTAVWMLANQPAADSGPRVHVHAAPAPRTHDGRLLRVFGERVRAGYRAFLAADDPAGVFAALADFTILCAARQGLSGVNAVNQLVEEILAQRDPALPRGHTLRPSSGAYDHRVIMVTQNDYEHGLFNGDLGVILRGAGRDGGDLRAWFPDSPGPDGSPQFRSVTPERLPAHETAFAMTIHKSQGSEFGNLMIVLPPEASALVTRELLYTAITRLKPDRDRPKATGRLDLISTAAVFQFAVATATERSSGLCNRLLKRDI